MFEDSNTHIFECSNSFACVCYVHSIVLKEGKYVKIRNSET